MPPNPMNMSPFAEVSQPKAASVYGVPIVSKTVKEVVYAKYKKRQTITGNFGTSFLLAAFNNWETSLTKSCQNFNISVAHLIQLQNRIRTHMPWNLSLSQ